jgi:hypothetical protein
MNIRGRAKVLQLGVLRGSDCPRLGRRVDLRCIKLVTYLHVACLLNCVVVFGVYHLDIVLLSHEDLGGVR